jgi:hypothetical protein
MTTPATSEIASQLKVSGSVTLNASGNGVITFSSDHANQRWVISRVVVATNQAATATTIPYATLGLNTTAMSTMSAGNNLGVTASGNQDVFSGQLDIGPVDFLAVLFAPPPGQSGAPLAGVIASAVLTGTKYSRRGSG